MCLCFSLLVQVQAGLAKGVPDRPKVKGAGGKFRHAATQVLWTKLSTHGNGVGP